MTDVPMISILPGRIDTFYGLRRFDKKSGSFQFDPDWDGFCILYTDGGRVRIRAQNRQLTLAGGELLLCPLRFLRSYLFPHSGPFALWAFCVSLNDWDPHTLSCCILNPPKTEQELLGQLLEKMPEEKEAAPLFRFLFYLYTHINRRLSLKQICQDTITGRSRLESLFQEQFHCGALHVFHCLKIRAAQRMLREGRLNISQIADALGYRSVQYFSRQFKQLTGMPPTRYAAKNRAAQTAVSPSFYQSEGKPWASKEGSEAWRRSALPQ